MEVFFQKIEALDDPAYDLILFLEVEFGVHFLQSDHELGAILVRLISVTGDETRLGKGEVCALVWVTFSINAYTGELGAANKGLAPVFLDDLADKLLILKTKPTLLRHNTPEILYRLR